MRYKGDVAHSGFEIILSFECAEGGWLGRCEAEKEIFILSTNKIRKRYSKNDKEALFGI